MNIYCNSNGSIFHVDPSRVFQGSVGVDVVRFIGRFPSSAQVLMAYKLPNGTWTSPKMLTLVAELEEIQDANGGTFAVWEGRIGASPKIDENGAIVKDENGNVVFDLDYTITENYGTATIQFFVYGATAPITVNGVIQNVGNGLLATASFSFEIEKGVPVLIPEVDTDDAQALLTQILNVVANTQTLYGNVSEDVTKLQEDVQDLDKNKVNKSGDTMNGPLTVESQSGPGKTEVSEQGVFVTNDGKNGTAYDDGAIVNQGKRIVIPLKEGTVALAEDVVGRIELSMDPSNYKLFLMAFDAAMGTRVLSTSSIDLPLESMIVGGAYNDETKQIELTLQNGNVVSFPVDELVNGLISSSEKGAPNGVASLDAEGKVPKEQLPDDIGGGASEEAIEEAIAKVHRTYRAVDSQYGLTVGQLKEIVSSVIDGATVYIWDYLGSARYLVETVAVGTVVASIHSYDSVLGQYKISVLQYTYSMADDVTTVIIPTGTLKTLVSDTDYATDTKTGVVKNYYNQRTSGIEFLNDGSIRVKKADTADIDAKTSNTMPIVPANQDHAWKVSATTNTETFTDEEKAAACETIGAVKQKRRNFILYGTNSSGEETEVAWAATTPTNNSVLRRTGNGGAVVSLDVEKETADGKVDVDSLAVPKGWLENLPDNFSPTAEQKAKWKTWLENILS